MTLMGFHAKVSTALTSPFAFDLFLQNAEAEEVDVFGPNANMQIIDLLFADKDTEIPDLGKALNQSIPLRAVLGLLLTPRHRLHSSLDVTRLHTWLCRARMRILGFAQAQVDTRVFLFPWLLLDGSDQRLSAQLMNETLVPFFVFLQSRKDADTTRQHMLAVYEAAASFMKYDPLQCYRLTMRRMTEMEFEGSSPIPLIVALVVRDVAAASILLFQDDALMLPMFVSLCSIVAKAHPLSGRLSDGYTNQSLAMLYDALQSTTERMQEEGDVERPLATVADIFSAMGLNSVQIQFFMFAIYMEGNNTNKARDVLQNMMMELNELEEAEGTRHVEQMSQVIKNMSHYDGSVIGKIHIMVLEKWNIYLQQRGHNEISFALPAFITQEVNVGEALERGWITAMPCSVLHGPDKGMQILDEKDCGPELLWCTGDLEPSDIQGLAECWLDGTWEPIFLPSRFGPNQKALFHAMMEKAGDQAAQKIANGGFWGMPFSQAIRPASGPIPDGQQHVLLELLSFVLLNPGFELPFMEEAKSGSWSPDVQLSASVVRKWFDGFEEGAISFLLRRFKLLASTGFVGFALDDAIFKNPLDDTTSLDIVALCEESTRVAGLPPMPVVRTQPQETVA